MAKTQDSKVVNHNFDIYGRMIKGVAVGLPIKEWVPLKSHWTVKGHERLAESNHFLHELPSKVK